MPSKTLTLDTETLGADEASAAVLAEARAAGLEVGALTETGEHKVGADYQVSIFHAFDGREHKVPLYMTTGEGGAMSVFKYKFSREQIEAVGADPKWIGKRVWYHEPQTVERPIGHVLCRFSLLQPEEHKAIIEAKGFMLFCQNETKFITEAAEDLHVKRRHPKWYEFMAKKDERIRQDKAADSQETTNKALLAMIENLLASKEK